MSDLNRILTSETVLITDGASRTAGVGNAIPSSGSNGLYVRTVNDSRTFLTGRKSITTTAVQLTAASITTYKGVVVKADPLNSDIVFVGVANTVTADSSDSTDGFPLSPGESITLMIDAPGNVWAIAKSGTLKVWWLSV